MNIKVYIHVGPPKTATSAIQNWMQQNRKSLMLQSIYYPEHGLDENGVSSGNVLNIFNRAEDKSLSISKQKVEKVLTECKQNNCEILLLSSEFFFLQVEALLTVFPEAKVIAYIRFPLEVIESSYNQAVKRHNQIQPLGLPKEPLAYHLVMLEKMMQKYSKSSFIIRFYSEEFFVGGNIVSDLLSVVDAKGFSIDLPKVNASYSFEALEFKRWVNCFIPPEIQNGVDRLLQSYRGGIESYSLIKPADYQHYVEWFCIKLEAFFQDFPVDGYQQFVASLKDKPQKNYIKQSMSTEQFSQVTDYFIETNKGLIQLLVEEASRCDIAIEKRPDFYTALMLKDSQSMIDKLKHNIKTRITDWRFILERKIKNQFLKENIDQAERLNVALTELTRMRTILRIQDDVTDGEMFRELALYCERNGELNLAYRLMLRARQHKPKGQYILTKIAEYQKRLDIQEGGS